MHDHFSLTAARDMKAVGGDGLAARAVVLALFAVPMFYVAPILSVAVHEILGHGLSAVVLGGEFSGFVLKWDGMGSAYCKLSANAPLARQIIQLAAGMIATTVCGLVLWGAFFALRRRPDIQLLLLIGAAALLDDGFSYAFWNAYQPVPPGDIGRIIALCGGPQSADGEVVRWVVLVASGFLLAGTTFWLCAAVFTRIEALLLRGGQFRGKSRLLALLFFLALPDAIAGSVFDWNQLAPGIGFVPNVVGALGAVAVATILFWYRPKLKHEGPVPAITWRHIAVSWICLLAAVTGLVLWFSNGVLWGWQAEYQRMWEEVQAELAIEDDGRPRLIGPFSVSHSGEFLHCGAERGDSQHRYVIVPLGGTDSEPIPAPYDRILGAIWRPRKDHDELSVLVLGEVNAVKTFRVSTAGVSEISSHPEGPDREVRLPWNCWSPSGEILALWVSDRDLGDPTVARRRVGFSKDGGATISVSAIPWPFRGSWVDDDTLYMVHTLDGRRTALSKAELDVDSMTVETQEVLRSETYIALANRNLNGSFVYGIGDTLYRNHEVFAVLPQKMAAPVVDGGYIALVSKDGGRLVVLNATGHIVTTSGLPEKATCLGMSARRQTIYLTAQRPRDRVKVWAYDFGRDSEYVVVEASDLISGRSADSDGITD